MTDNCPGCLTSTEPQHPADEPHRYVCGACGHSWTTNRIPQPEAPYAAYDDPDAWEAEEPFGTPTADNWLMPPDPDPWGDQHDQVARILAAEATQTHITITRADQTPETP
ncbi:hypothetical protein [Streptomyces sp. bgisy091]|uniref:hypothetical protein n=1 Tax=Streptomyces sp. bgisy091 TaxID=3413778 RepID=UPI003D71A379